MKKANCVMLALVMICSLSACSKVNTVSTGTDILTQKPLLADKIPVTILVKYAFSINTFEAEAEKKFPKLDIIQVGNYTSDMGIEEYEMRMKNDDLTDIVMTWPLDVGEKYWGERLIDLSSLPITGKYTTSMLDNISRDGKLFYLPAPSQVRGIVYNKTMFEENGWQIPADFEGFLNLCKEIEKTGVRSLQLGLKNLEVLDTAFVGYGYDASFSRPENAQKIAKYNKGVGSFSDNFLPALDTFQRLIDEGVLQKNDLNVNYADRERMLFSRQCAMVEDSVLITHMGFDMNGSTDEFALMPFFNPGENNDWARLYPVCYVGANKHLEEDKNKEKHDMVMKLLEYISTPEGQVALSGDTGAMFSSLKGVEVPNIPEIKDLMDALSQGRYAVFPTLENSQDVLREGLAGMVDGSLTSTDVIKMVDAENVRVKVVEPRAVIGNASADFSLIETGNFITDVMKKKSGTEIALFLDNGKDGRYNGKGVSGKLYEGDLGNEDIKRIFPDLKLGEKGELWKITMTGEDLIKTLEYAIPVGKKDGGWFYYFSGLKMEYDPVKKQGNRISKITDSEGQEIEPKRIYSIAVMDETVKNEYIKTCEKTGILISDLLVQEMKDTEIITPSGDSRFTVVGDNAKIK